MSIRRLEAVFVDRPTRGQFLPAFRALSDVDEGRGAARLIDRQRRSVFDRRGESERIGAIDRSDPARDCHQRRAVGRSEGDEAGLCEAANVIAEFARGVAVVLREDRTPQAAQRCRRSSKARSNPELRDPAAGVGPDDRRGGG